MYDKQNTEARTSVGAHLKRLREEKNLTIAEVSSRLYLQPNIIEALEQDDHENLPTGTYVYGYLQNYAKLLDTPADRVVSMFKEDIDISAQPEPVREVAPELKPEQSNKWPYTLLYLIIFVAILLPLTWWWGQRTLGPATPGWTFPGSADAPLGLAYPITIVEHPDTPFYRAPNTEQMDKVQAAAQEQTTESQTAPAQTQGAQTTDTDKEFEVAPSTYDKNMITTGIGPDSIKVVVSEDCWVEIFDTDNKKIFYDLARAGQTLILNGTAPFSVLLGNSAGAIIEFNNIPFDTTSYRSRIGMARFVLGRINSASYGETASRQGDARYAAW